LIVLDATVIIGHLNPHDAHHTRATELLAGLDADESLGASVLTLGEVMVGPARAGEQYLAIARRAIARLGIAEIGWGDDAAISLARLRATTKLNMPDCCVLAAAREVGGPIATFDAALTAAARAAGMEIVS
jgi:predicted nucleic acid-binding protein